MPFAKKTLYQFLLLIISCIFSMGLFFAAYRYDNKYTLHTPQAIGGILFFDPDTDSATHLMNGWQYYRNQLLTPKDFTGELPLPDGYLSVGQYPGMETGRKDASPHGSITYSMILALPETPASYTLELPEIYSAYRLYIGDALAASQGNPNKEHYEPQIHSGSVTFEASGNTRILLSVSDWSWLYSGLVYPPAFGAQEPVDTLLNQKFAWGLSVTVLALLLGAFQVVLSILLRSRRILYASLICLAFAGSVSSAPFHRLISTGVMPFYSLELFSRYAIYGAAVLLVSHLYGKRTKAGTVFSAAAAIFPFLSFGISMAAPSLSLQGMLLFSLAAEVYKIACAVWILRTVFLIGNDIALRADHFILLIGTCVFASSLAADRLLPSFEPIRFGWFSEIAGLIFAILISYFMFHNAFRLYKDRLLLAKQKEQLQAQLQLQRKRYADLTEQLKNLRAMRHDIRHHYTQLGLLLKNDDYEEAKKYLHQLDQSILKTASVTFCKNYMADILFRYYYTKATEADIPISIRAALPSDLGLPDEDLSVILGNILDNALEASLCIPQSKRMISLTALLHSNNLVIESSNTFNGTFEKDGENYLSSKEKGRIGIGISSLQAIAEKYDGNIWIDTDESDGEPLFTIRILIITSHL